MWHALLSAALAFATAHATQPPKIERHTSPNGLTVLVVENHSVPLVTVEIGVRTGSMHEPPEYNGLSHLYEHMFFKANAVIPDQERWLERANELGLLWNGTTQTERVNYFFSTTSDHFKDGMVFMRDATVTPLFDPDELERERVVVTGEIDRAESTPSYYLFRKVSDRLFFKYPSRKDPLGNRQTVLAATRKKMQTIQKRFYLPNNSVLVVTGDVKAADVFALADSLYASWKPGPDPMVKYPLVKHPPLARTEVLVVEQPVQTVRGTFAWQGPSTVGPGVELTYAADLLGTALAEPSSRFQQALVDSGACVEAGISWATQMNTGPIHLGFEAAPDKVDDCVRAIVAELPRIDDNDYLTDAEMRNAAHTLEVQQVRDRERPSNFAHTLTFWWASAGLDYYLGYIDHLYGVKRSDIARFMDELVLGRPYVLGVMVSPELKARGLDAAHFESLVAPAQAKEAARW